MSPPSVSSLKRFHWKHLDLILSLDGVLYHHEGVTTLRRYWKIYFQKLNF